MLKSYFKTAWRNLVRNKIYSGINIFGLALGMAACFFIFQYVHLESQYDRFHANASGIYRVPITFLQNRMVGGVESQTEDALATNHPALGPAMKRDFSEVLSYVRMANLSLLSYKFAISSQQPGTERRIFNETNIFLADSSFFTVFSFPLIKGKREQCLAEPNTIVISTSTAQKYFGDSDPINQTLTLNGDNRWSTNKQFPFKVTGVFADLPENSHMKFNMIISFETARQPMESDNNWQWPEYYNYVLLAPGADPQKLEAKFPAFIEKYLGEIMKQYGFRASFHLQPITDIHLNSNFRNEIEVNGSEKEVYFLSVIGVFILIIAWINYINLSTAKSMERANEVGIRKVAGARRQQLIGQFLFESFLINLAALLIAMLIIAGAMPLFDSFTGKNSGAFFFSSGLGSQPSFWIALLALFATGALLVGLYPAFVLSSFKPVRVLKGLIIKSNTGISLRRVLVSFQFVLSIMLIAATLIVFKQLHYMRNADLGYKKDQVLVLKSPTVIDSTMEGHYHFLKSELLKLPFVTNATTTSDIPGNLIQVFNTMYLANQDRQSGVATFMAGIDQDFLKTYNVELLAGRNFLSSDTTSILPNNNANVLINEENARQLGFKTPGDAVNKEIVFAFSDWEVRSRVIGVVKNYHQRSFKDKYDPILYLFPSGGYQRFISATVNVEHLDNNLAAIASLYKKTFPGNAFEHFFQDDFFNRQYLADQRLGNVFGLFTALAIIVACLGLLGLSSFVIKLRTKEIGIRKVLGASVSGILVLISKDFIKLVCLAAAIAIPIVYWMAGKWLSNYAFHIRLSWFTFIIPPLVLLVIALLTVCLQSLKAAMANPVAALRSE